MASEDGKKMVTLRSCDGKEFKVAAEACVLSELLKHLIDDGFANSAIPLHKVDGRTLAKVVEYLEKHAQSAAETPAASVDGQGKGLGELKAWDSEFMTVDTDVLYFLIMASNYLGIKGLLELCAQRAANIIKGKQPEEIRKSFKIKNDFSREEEEAIREKYSWAFDTTTD